MSVSIVKGKNDRLYDVRVYYYDLDSKGNKKRKAKVKKNCNGHKEAKAWADEMDAKYNHTDLSALTKSQELFADSFWNWFETYKEATVSKITRRTYQNTKKFIEDDINIPLEDMNRDKYQKFLNKIGRDYSKETTEKKNVHIKAFEKHLLYEGIITKSFTYGTTVIYNESKTKPVTYLELSEMKKVLSYIEEHNDRHYTSKFLIASALRSGCRISELEALQWKDLDEENLTIDINKSYDVTTQSFKKTKTVSSNRMIKVNKAFFDMLRPLKRNSVVGMDPDNLPEPNGNVLIFKNQYGTVPSYTAVNKTLRDVLKACKIDKPMHFHSLRHSYASMLISTGEVDLWELSKILGHANIQTTSDTYLHLINEAKLKQDTKIDKALDKLD